jgi:hypothetical protein
MLSFREVFVACLGKLLGDVVLEIVCSESIVVGNQDVLIDIPFHVILKIELNHKTVVVQILLEVGYLRRHILGCPEENNGSALVILADVLKYFEGVIVIEGLEGVFVPEVLLPIEILLDR